MPLCTVEQFSALIRFQILGRKSFHALQMYNLQPLNALEKYQHLCFSMRVAFRWQPQKVPHRANVCAPLLHISVLPLPFQIRTACWAEIDLTTVLPSVKTPLCLSTLLHFPYTAYSCVFTSLTFRLLSAANYGLFWIIQWNVGEGSARIIEKHG